MDVIHYLVFFFYVGQKIKVFDFLIILKYKILLIIRETTTSLQKNTALLKSELKQDYNQCFNSEKEIIIFVNKFGNFRKSYSFIVTHINLIFLSLFFIFISS